MSFRVVRTVLALLTVGVLLSWPGSISAQLEVQREARLLRFPHVNGNTVVFTYAGDLYTAPLAGGRPSA